MQPGHTSAAWPFVFYPVYLARSKVTSQRVTQNPWGVIDGNSIMSRKHAVSPRQMWPDGSRTLVYLPNILGARPQRSEQANIILSPI